MSEPNESPSSASSSRRSLPGAFAGTVLLVFVLTGISALVEYRERADLHRVELDKAWLLAARNSLAATTYENLGKPLGCATDCTDEEYGFLNALLLSATTETHCLLPSFERQPHRNGCQAYLAALKAEEKSIRGDFTSPPNLCLHDEALWGRLTTLHESARRL